MQNIHNSSKRKVKIAKNKTAESGLFLQTVYQKKFCVALPFPMRCRGGFENGGPPEYFLIQGCGTRIIAEKKGKAEGMRYFLERNQRPQKGGIIQN